MMFSKIITLSLNPALDVTLWTETLMPDSDNIVQDERYDAAGKAVNVSRTLRYYDVDNLAIVLAGCHNLHRYEQQLRNERVHYRIITIEGYIRENISIVQPDRTVTRLLREGFYVEYEAVDEIQKVLTESVEAGSLVVISGSLPKGINSRIFKQICAHIHSLGAKIALDTSSLVQEDIYEIKPWAIKPNYAELCGIVGRKMVNWKEMVEIGRDMNAHGVEHCIISVGQEGLMYVGHDRAIRAEVPEIDVVSSVGAGDSALAGFIMSMQQGRDLENCVRMATAFGTAACLTDGTNPPARLATANILQQVKLREMDLA